MTLESTGTSKKCCEHGGHFLMGGLKHTTGLIVAHYGVKATGRLQ
jgi:hypothetical protein